MDRVGRSVLWHRLISEVDIPEYYGVKKGFSFDEQVEYMRKYGRLKNDHRDEIKDMNEKLIRFSQSNPESINEAADDVRDILMQTMPKFLKKYPQYKGEPCIESDD